MLVYGVDLGTTNVKVVLFDDRLRRLAVAQAPAEYDRSGPRVEFDPVRLFDVVLGLIARCADHHGSTAQHDAVIAITGQAESLVLTDAGGRPVRPAISWLDDRAIVQARDIADEFGTDHGFAVTGEPESSATWPAAKLRWLAQHEPDTLAEATRVLMLKDDLIQRFTGQAVGELTTRGFTYLYDVTSGAYWDAMLDFCSVRATAMPRVVRAGLDVGTVRSDVLERLPASASAYRVNVGALDHFCAMIGTGSYEAGVMSESAGTVLSLSMLAPDWAFDPARRISFHAGVRPGETLLFSGVDSGGVALEWFRAEGLGGMPYGELEKHLCDRTFLDAPIFLPYLTGVNPPDFLPNAKGAFIGLDLSHDRFDLAYAVEEGIAQLLRRNVEYFDIDGTGVREIVSTGGGASSAFWNQLKADVCGLDVLVPHEQEATCRGAAVLALVEHGALSGFDEASELNQPEVVRYRPSGSGSHSARYRAFEDYLERLYVR